MNQTKQISNERMTTEIAIGTLILLFVIQEISIEFLELFIGEILDNGLEQLIS